MRILAALLLAGVPSACSGDPQADYCNAVEQHQLELSDIAASSGTASIFAALPIYEDLADRAPRNITGQWAAVIQPLRALEQALDRAGVDPSAYDAEERPADLDPADRAEIEAAARQLGSEQTVSAMSGVEQHALDVCGTPLSR